MRTQMQNYMRHRRGGKPAPDWKALAHEFQPYPAGDGWRPLCVSCLHGEAHAIHHGGDWFHALPPIQETR